MYKAFLIKYAEIAIKGKNRYLFEDALVSQMNHALKKVDGTFRIRKEQGRIYIEMDGEYDYDEAVEALKCVFGIVGICPVVILEDEGFDKLAEEVIHHIDEAYPDKLRNIHNPPYSLFYIGTLPDKSRKSVAIVGARGRSAYGCEVAKVLAAALSRQGIQIISGMARGIDRDAHMGCLEAGGNTYAVLGSGADTCYPKENRFLYDKIKVSGGIISELMPGTDPQKMFFPMRNRIISALSDIVVIVEAKKRSGSLITADFAMEQGKDVYVIPGRITDTLSYGCNSLIKQGAGIIYNIDEFVSDITMTGFTECTQMDFRKNILDKKEALVYSLLDFCPIAIGTLSQKVPYELSELFEVLEDLIQKGFVKETIPNYYIRSL